MHPSLVSHPLHPLQANYPRCPEDVTLDWLEQMMEKKLSSFKLVKILESGVTSDAAIFALEYSAGVKGSFHRLLIGASGRLLLLNFEGGIG